MLVELNEIRSVVDSEKQHSGENELKVHEVVRSVVAEASVGDAWIERGIVSFWGRGIDQVSDLGKVVDVHDLLDVQDHFENLFIDVLVAVVIGSIGLLRRGNMASLSSCLKTREHCLCYNTLFDWRLWTNWPKCIWLKSLGSILSCFWISIHFSHAG